MIAPIPKTEKKRLEVLWQYDVLDTVPEKTFDDLTNLAALICEAPIAMLTLVDDKRQWFKSKTGISANETHRDISFCAHAVLQTKMFIVPDAANDARFARNALVTGEPKIRFYAGAPLITADGHALGTLCVIDKVPRTLRPDQKRALEILSNHVMTQLELRRRSSELERARAERESILCDLRQARADLAKAKKQLVMNEAQLRKGKRELDKTRK
jgi:GAF domain-containing protein